MLEWNEGLSLGVKVLDDDHKKLLEIINKLSIAIDENSPDEAYNEIFDDLDEFVSIHFTREESFMNRCNYEYIDEHKKQHSDFASKVPEVKASFFAAKDYASAQEVVIFLTDWLVNHIINEDLKLVESFEKCALEKKEKENTSLLKLIVDKTTNSISFSNRIFLSVLIPLTGMLLLSSFTIYDNFKNYLNIKKTAELSSIVYTISDLTNSLQLERGLSSGYLTSKENKFQEALEKQRGIVDKNIKIFNDKITSNEEEMIESISTYLNNFNSKIAFLKDVRKQIDKKTISEFEEILFYKDMIENIIDITSKIEIINLNNDIANSLENLSDIMHYKESLGLKRAYGTIIIEKQNTDSDGYLAFTQLLNSKDTLKRATKRLSNEKNIEYYESILNSNLSKLVLYYENKIKTKDIKDLDSKIWFVTASKYIEDIGVLEKEFIKDLQKVIITQKEKKIEALTMVIAYMMVILLISLLLLYIFKISTKKQINELTSAMMDLSKGGRGFRFKKLSAKDDITSIHDAYEVTRIKLLKGDIYRQLYLSKKEIELKNYERENAQLETVAYLDPLTGCSNRRKFDELTSIEIARSLRYENKLSFLLMDIDYFKRINDTYGHAIGDEILIHFVNECKRMLRNVDTIARIGGEEFVIMLVETDEENAMKFAQRIRKNISDSELIIKGKKINFTVSIGISGFNKSKDKGLKTILERADKALYKAKKSGRNQCVLYSDI